MTAPRAHRAWWVLGVIAGALAAVALAQWAVALVSGRPIVYGEGAVAHAAILMRDGATYRDHSGVVAANYPPLYFALTSLAEPLRLGRALTIASALAIAAMLAWRARDGAPVVRGALGLSWVALAPVAIWGAAVKPDMLAVALTLAGVVLLERSRGRDAFFAGALLAAAVWAKPTALLPAVAVLAWAAVVARPSFGRASAGAMAVATLALVHAAALGVADVWRHVVSWNALAWSPEQVLLVGVLALATIGIVIAAGLVGGGSRGIALAYLGGALGVVILAGREGATINYLLDVAAAAMFALARSARAIGTSSGAPLAVAFQLAFAFWLLAPFGIVPGRDATTGAWGRADRLDVVRELGPGAHLVEDSGLLIAAGREPVVDDLFLWSRLVRAGAVDPAPVLDRVRAGQLASVVSEADLERLADAPAYERARWHPTLVREVLERYELAHRAGGLWVYRPR